MSIGFFAVMRCTMSWKTGIRLEPPTISASPTSSPSSSALSSALRMASSTNSICVLQRFSNSLRVSVNMTGFPPTASGRVELSLVESSRFISSALAKASASCHGSSKRSTPASCLTTLAIFSRIASSKSAPPSSRSPLVAMTSISPPLP